MTERLTYKPLTYDEWKELMSMTLHGPLPQKTLYRVYATVDFLFSQSEAVECVAPENLVGDDRGNLICRATTKTKKVKRKRVGCPGCGYTFRGKHCPRCGGE